MGAHKKKHDKKPAKPKPSKKKVSPSKRPKEAKAGVPKKPRLPLLEVPDLLCDRPTFLEVLRNDTIEIPVSEVEIDLPDVAPDDTVLYTLPSYLFRAWCHTQNLLRALRKAGTRYNEEVHQYQTWIQSKYGEHTGDESALRESLRRSPADQTYISNASKLMEHSLSLLHNIETRIRIERKAAEHLIASLFDPEQITKLCKGGNLVAYTPPEEETALFESFRKLFAAEDPGSQTGDEDEGDEGPDSDDPENEEEMGDDDDAHRHPPSVGGGQNSPVLLGFAFLPANLLPPVPTPGGVKKGR